MVNNTFADPSSSVCAFKFSREIYSGVANEH